MNSTETPSFTKCDDCGVVDCKEGFCHHCNLCWHCIDLSDGVLHDTDNQNKTKEKKE